MIFFLDQLKRKNITHKLKQKRYHILRIISLMDQSHVLLMIMCANKELPFYYDLMARRLALYLSI